MAYRIARHEDLAAGLIRLLRRDLGRALDDVRSAGGRPRRIHKVRQRLKRMRTILRTLEPVFGDRAVAARRSLTDAARLLARARDADVAAASARVLAGSTADAGLGFAGVADKLDIEAAEAHAARTPIATVVNRLAEADATIARFDPGFDGDTVLAAALRKAYARGRSAMTAAEGSLAAPDFHAWRKAVKDLWHLLVVAQARLPKMRKRRDRLDRLGEILGLDNDHAALAEKLALSPDADLALMSRLAVITNRRRALEAEAFDLGRRLYRRKPKAFARRTALR